VVDAVKGRLRVTVVHGGSGICSRCQYGQVMERREGQTTTFCHNFYPERAVPPDIVKCNEYLDARQQTKHELEKIAWVIRHDRSGAIKGFEPPKKTDRDA
jgi:hypothetical protein